jgi:uncharacterized membrane protein YgdD (TMEM256/DUF423 family)
MSRTAAIFIFLAGLNGLISVLAGAWAAHGFVIPVIAGGDVLAETGSRFQMWHALALLGLAAAHDHAPTARTGIAHVLGSQALFRLAGIAFIIGIAGFSGGLYATAAGTPFSGLAPLGGTAFMVGWLLLVLAGVVAFFSRR